MDNNEISNIIIGCAIEVHKLLGPGLLESTYERCMKYELEKKNLNVITQLELPIRYKEIVVDKAYRIDMLIENSVVLELKSVDAILPVHKSQVLTYLKLSELKLGLLINFNVPLLKDGIVRLIK